MKLNEWVNNYIKEVTHSHEYEDMSQMGEDENDPQEISVGNYQTKYFHVCPGASKLYGDIESKGVDMDMAERSARLQDALYFVEEHIQRDGYKPERDYVMVAKNIAKNIMKMAEMMGLENEHDYIQGHVDTIEKVVKEKGLEEKVMELTEENVPTNPSKWSYYKSQAKKKFDVYPSAYANAWAAKQYKAAGGGWKTKKKESVNESDLKGQLAGDSVQDIIKSIGSRFVSGEIKNTKRDGKTYIKLKDEKFGSGVVKILKSRFGIDAKLDYYGGKGKVASSPSVSFFSDTIIDESLKEAYVIFYAKKKGDKPSQAAYRDKDMALKFEKDLKKDGYITMVTQKKIKGVDESVNEESELAYLLRRMADVGGAEADEFLSNNKVSLHKIKLALRNNDFTKYDLRDVIQGKAASSINKKVMRRIKESVNEAQKVNPTSKKFLKGMKKIKVKGLGGYMPGVDYVYVDGDKYYFVDFEGDHMELKNTNTIKQLHKLHGSSLGESVNEVSVGDFEIGDFVHFKSKNKTGMVVSVKGNKVTINTPKGKITSDVKDVKVLHQDNVNEYIEPQTKKIASLTGTRPEAVKDFVSKHALNITKLLKFVEKGKLPERMAIVSALAGRPGNPVQKKIIKQFSESINEDYYKSASDAADAARKYAEKKGFEIDEDDWQTQIAMGGKHNRLRPGVGKTHSFSVGLTKNGKPQRKALNISLYGMDSGKFELTSYIN